MVIVQKPMFKNHISTGTCHDAKTLRAKARKRAAKGSRKVQKSVPTTSLVAWHSRTVAHADGFFLTNVFRLSRPSFSRQARTGTRCNVAVQQLSVRKCYQYYCSHHQYHCPSMSTKALPGQMLQNGFLRKARGRRAKGTQNADMAREGSWPLGLQ